MYLMLPYTHDPPTFSSQTAEIPLVPFAGCFDLPLPERCKLVTPLWISPSMPKVAIDEDGDLWADKHDVRLTG